MNKIKERKNRICEFVNSGSYAPLTSAEMKVVLDVPDSDIELFYTVINELVGEGRLSLSKKGRIVAPVPVKTGVLKGISKGNCVFVYDGGEMFIPAENLNGAYHKDTVSVVVTEPQSKDYRAVGKVIKVLERGTSAVPGILEKRGKYFVCVPDDKRLGFDVIISSGKTSGAVKGQKVLTEIDSYEGRPRGKVIKTLGREGDPLAEVLSIVIQNSIPYEFSAKALKQAEKINTHITDAEISGRCDFRDELTVTIDGEDTKDFDDAVTIEKRGDTFVLGVHIADVAHYVPENSAIDKDALNRGNSVYLPDMVIPMLPFELSNGVCSLIEGQDRLAVSCIMEIDAFGSVINYDIKESVININKRFTYSFVAKAIENSDKAFAAPEFKEMFYHMDELSKILINKRAARGALDFDTTECKVVLDESGYVKHIYPYERNTATKIIEEFMILANETVAEHCFWRGLPFIYRVHGAPDTERVTELSEFLRNFGMFVKGGTNIHPRALQTVLNEIKGTEKQKIISKKILQAMKRAAYYAENKGHFGLSLKYYCHFTSPIRRYADLQIHRIIKESLRGGDCDKYEARCANVSQHVSKTERNAETVEREVIKLKMAEYMQAHAGAPFNGVISHVVSYGIFVELENSIEGFVHVSVMRDDYYVHDEKHMMFIGERTNKTYRLGDKVTVKVYNVSLKDRTIDFIFV